MAVLIGQLIGGCIAIYLLSLGIERVAFRTGRPSARALKTVAVAWIVAAVLAGFGMADENGFAMFAGAYYLLPAITIFFLLRRKYRRASPPLGDVFK